MKKQKLYYSSLAYALTAVIVGLPTTSHAAPGTLWQEPLFITNTNAAESNVFFLTDDSRSMDWDMLTLDRERDSRFTANQPNGTDVADAGSIKHRDDDNDGIADCDFSSGEGEGDGGRYGYMYIVDFDSNNLHSEANNCNVADDEAWRARNSDFNPLYFDPTKDYAPWGGVDSNDAPYTDYRNETHFNNLDLPDDPYNSGDTINPYKKSSGRNGTTFRNLTGGFRFYTWDDTDADGNFDNQNSGDTVIEYAVGSITNTEAATARGEAGYTARMLKGNFANWFTYHRKREYVAKYAFSTAIKDMTGIRMGYGSINNNNSNNIEIASMNLNPGTGNKRALLNKLFLTSSDNSTPIVDNLDNVGKYFKNENGSFFGDSGSYSDPIASVDAGGTCQFNNTILMTDGYYTDGSDSTNLASIAAQYYNDLRPGNEYTGDQHMSTYTVAFGVKGTLEPDTDVFADDFSWPDPTASNAAKIDDLWHAAVNSEGKFFSANDSEELTKALTSVVEHISSRTQSATSIAMSSFRSTADSLFYFSSFDPVDWSGELFAVQIDTDGSLSDSWNAATVLDNNPNNSTSRTILSFNGEDGVAFQWNDISPVMQSALIAGDTVTEDVPDTEKGQQRLNYLRGQTIAGFRERSSLLGDIANSSPVHVGAPASSYPDTYPFGDDNHRYFSFWNSNQDRTPVIYVGANDGMLHGFNAQTGAELMAYVPETVVPNLHQLTDPDYTHRFFVDETPSVADAFFAQHGVGTANWKTVLVGGLGAGGKGLFALDITNPASFSNDNAATTVLWEFNAADETINLDNVETSDDYSDLGHTFGQPVIGLMENGRWAAIIGNGYNSDSGVATLFIIYLDANPTDANGWQEGSDYIKISTTVGGPADADKNGLSSPTAIDSNGNGKVDRIYAGDLEGNMWAFNLTDSSNIDNWNVAYESNSIKQPLYQAKNAAGDVQPITVKPSVIRNPSQPTLSNTRPNLLVLFGTGQYLTRDDLDSTQTQSFYGVWDKGQAIVMTDDEPRTDKLIAQTITEGTDGGQNAVEARITSDTYVPYNGSGNSQRFGWYIDLNTASASTGERVASDAVVFNNTVFFTTYIPDDNACGSGGDGWFMFLNAANGGHPDDPIININRDSMVNEEDDVSIGDFTDTAPSGLKTNNTLASPTLDLSGSVLIHTNDGIDRHEADLGGSNPSRRISWRELRPN